MYYWLNTAENKKTRSLVMNPPPYSLVEKNPSDKLTSSKTIVRWHTVQPKEIRNSIPSQPAKFPNSTKPLMTFLQHPHNKPHQRQHASLGQPKPPCPPCKRHRATTLRRSCPRACASRLFLGRCSRTLRNGHR
jgi:hypothetical protein